MGFERARFASRSLVVFAALAGFAKPAFADEEQSGFEAGFRVGYAVPMGNVSGDEPMTDGIVGHIPLWFDIGYRVTPHVVLGAYGQYGFGFFSEDTEEVCDNLDAQAEAAGGSASCSIAIARLGLQAQYRFTPEQESSGWLGLGVGYEWMPVSVEADAGGRSVEASTTAHGFEFFNLQFGWDFDVARSFRLGPFVAFSLAQYSDTSIECSGDITCPTAASLGDKALHQWLFFGARGVFSP